MGADGFGFFGLLSPPQKREGEGVAVGRNGHWVREGGEGGGPPPDIAKGEEREAGCVEGGGEGRGGEAAFEIQHARLFVPLDKAVPTSQPL